MKQRYSYTAELFDGHMTAGHTEFEASGLAEAMKKAQVWANSGDWHTEGEVMLRLRLADADGDAEDEFYGAIRVPQTSPDEDE